eukprot:CAMPEP_0170132768 /NCGR_PEP_ID=MMETSP0033_2-20121228/749_1 /TAXON_ID=195969 /ORGANISM="Dolichomastix tenuilepis, Strain CCMP3274" /LENGTH=49 /DNA_ID=CAMNT_0010368197 /DNA_START=182 /DNA_END=331 /DNA_ORIENTATION=-
MDVGTTHALTDGSRRRVCHGVIEVLEHAGAVGGAKRRRTAPGKVKPTKE